MEVKANLVVRAFGERMSTGMYPEDWLDGSGEVKVGKTLAVEVEEEEDAFAIGNVAATGENRMAYYGRVHVEVVEANAKLRLAGKEAAKKALEEALESLAIPGESQEGGDVEGGGLQPRSILDFSVADLEEISACSLER